MTTSFSSILNVYHVPSAMETPAEHPKWYVHISGDARGEAYTHEDFLGAMVYCGIHGLLIETTPERLDGSGGSWHWGEDEVLAAVTTVVKRKAVVDFRDMLRLMPTMKPLAVSALRLIHTLRAASHVAGTQVELLPQPRRGKKKSEPEIEITKRGLIIERVNNV